ncbi:histidine kinase [Clavibacter michiganensis subsp. phaseoli]|uniref:histidine kinase n=1 Tax=Clavibacter phaseoli TaxID=1734031 RepID=A0A8I0SBV9_9MICO|nr:histidine kinase [Clavibacter phaseoli]MBF4632601.1 histidine kinase [Clavibacter phaseoli]
MRASRAAASRDAADYPRPLYRDLRLLDRGAVVLSVAAVVVEMLHVQLDGGGPSGWSTTVVLALGVGIVRRWPRTGLAVVLVASILAAVFWDPLVPWTVTVFTLFSVVVRGQSAPLMAAVASVVAFSTVEFRDGFRFDSTEAYIAAACAIGAAGAASGVRNREQYYASLVERAHEAEATREIEAERRVAEERLRIARDLHDAVGHEVAVVNMHLGVIEVTLPPGSERALSAVSDARRGLQSVLAETQSILAVLRRGASGTADDHLPPPGLAQLPALLQSYASIGLVVDAQVDDMPPLTDVTVDTALYRIVQELMTNAHKYGTGTARLTVVHHEDRLEIASTNPVRSSAAAPGSRVGHGLVGMRERAAAAGGTVAVTEDGDAFEVRVSLRADRAGAR